MKRKKKKKKKEEKKMKKKKKSKKKERRSLKSGFLFHFSYLKNHIVSNGSANWNTFAMQKIRWIVILTSRAISQVFECVEKYFALPTHWKFNIPYSGFPFRIYNLYSLKTKREWLLREMKSFNFSLWKQFSPYFKILAWTQPC